MYIFKTVKTLIYLFFMPLTPGLNQVLIRCKKAFNRLNGFQWILQQPAVGGQAVGSSSRITTYVRGVVIAAEQLKKAKTTCI